METHLGGHTHYTCTFTIEPALENGILIFDSRTKSAVWHAFGWQMSEDVHLERSPRGIASGSRGTRRMEGHGFD